MPDVTGSHAAAVGLDTTWDGDVLMNMEEDLPVRQPTNTSSVSYFIEEYPGASEIFGQGETLLDHFYNDGYSHLRDQFPYYPFASHSEWELASFLLRSDLSMSALDDFFKLSMVSSTYSVVSPIWSNQNQQIQRLSLSFSSAKDLRSRAELLPSGPKWKCKTWNTRYPTKHAVELLYRDPLECLQSLLQSPFVKDFLKFTPFRLFKTAERTVRIFTEWLSGETAWLMQVRLHISI